MNNHHAICVIQQDIQNQPNMYLCELFSLIPFTLNLSMHWKEDTDSLPNHTNYLRPSTSCIYFTYYHQSVSSIYC